MKIKAVALCCMIMLVFSFVLPVSASQDEKQNQEKKGRGLISSQLKVEYEPESSDVQNLPSKFLPKEAKEDLADYSAPITSVKDQDALGTCWIFAAYGNMESYLKQKYGLEYDFSENHAKNLLARGMTLEKNPYSFDYDIYAGGNFDMMMAYWTRENGSGPVLEEEDPYNTDGEKKVNLSEALSKSTTGHYVTGSKTLGTISFRSSEKKNWWNSTKQKSYVKDMKAMIKQYGAIYASYYSSAGTDHIFTYEDGRTGAAYLSDKKKNDRIDIAHTDHAVTVVGWDDTFSRKNFSASCRPEKNGAFLIKNSWGTEEGENGYFWISYEEYFSQASTITGIEQRADLYDHLYEYDLLGTTNTQYCFNSSKLVYMNQFYRMTTKQQKVTAVSSFFAQSGVTANVYVSPTRDSSKLKLVATKEIKDTGFQVIKFDDQAVTITDSRYLVAIELIKNKNDYLEYPVEDQWSDYTSNAQASSGQSYVTIGGISVVRKGNYTDVTKKSGYEEMNVCIKAYTKDTGVNLKSLSKAIITKCYHKTYIGEATSQNPEVELDGKILKEGTDYRIFYKNHKNPGIATMTIVGNGRYSGSITKEYQIAPKSPTIASISSTSKRGLKLKWDCPYKADGFQIYIKKAGSSNYVWKKTTSSDSTTLTNLSSKKRYYVKVRAYKTVNGKRIYSTFSKWRSKTIK